MNQIDRTWHEMLVRQAGEREELTRVQEGERNAYFMAHRDHFNSAPVFDPERDWNHGNPTR